MNKDQIREIVSSLAAAGEGDGYLVARAQSRRESGIRLSNGRFEYVGSGWENGLGVQAFTAAGASGLAAADVLSLKVGLELVRRAVSLAERNEEIGGELNRELWDAPVVQADVPSPAAPKLPEIGELQPEMLYIHESLRRARPQASWQTSLRLVQDLWCIGRSDGSLVSFTISRSVIMHQGTVQENGRSQSLLVHRSGVDAGIVAQEKHERTLEQQAAERADFALEVCRAPSLTAGHYPLVIDYGLAKGLAHEAFGHAVEADGISESVLGEHGRLRKGLQVARPGVHIIDGPLFGDWAYQPYSANALERRTVYIVRDGILEAGLGDIFSARRAGMEVSGAGRAESYNYVPLPRMSNIRVLSERVLPLEPSSRLPQEMQNLRNSLLQHGELKEHTLVLLGYRGGQVNPKTGDFVFQCDGIIDLSDPELKVYQPSIFSGKILSVLQAIRAGIGDECFGAIGTCGKNGQSVPSSGGSHRYLLLDQDEQVSLGGA
ncbi:TldD/PmbA family protein [Paradesulfitobacterium aromaticivorans]